MNLYDFVALDVINLADGNRIGCIVDLIFTMPLGQIQSIIVAGSPRVWWRFWGRRDDVIIPWSNVVTVGIDAILVNLV